MIREEKLYKNMGIFILVKVEKENSHKVMFLLSYLAIHSSIPRKIKKKVLKLL